MRCRTLKAAALLTLAMFCRPVPGQATAPPYQPAVGDPVFVWQHFIKAGHEAQAREFFLQNLLPRLKSVNQRQKTYFLVNEDGTRILVVSFRSDKASQPAHNAAVAEGMEAHAARERTQTSYQVAALLDEEIIPQAGDKAVVFLRLVKPGKMGEAVETFRSVLFPAFAQDNRPWDGYLLANPTENRVCNVVFCRGADTAAEIGADGKGKARLEPLLAEPDRKEIYTVFAISE